MTTEPVDVRRKEMVMTEAETDALVVHWGFDDIDRALQNMALEIERLRAAPEAQGEPVADWREANPLHYEPHYTQWISRLTTERLHSKSDIALALAIRDAALAAARK